MNHRSDPTALRSISVIGLLAALVLALPHVGQADQSGDAYKLQPGHHRVTTIKNVVLRDTARGKDLQLRITHPDGAGPFPVIIFSHGAFGTKDNYLILTEYWASHGYVAIQANHSDSRALGVRVGDPRAFADWQSRPADVSFIIDALEDLARREAALQGKSDPRRIGVGGHSFGANTAQLVGGAKAVVAGNARSFEDRRVTAVVLLSGQGPGEMLTEKSWEAFTRPMLVMTGSRDGPSRTGQPAAWRRKPYELSPPPDKYLVWVEGLDHGFGGISGVNIEGRWQANEDHVNVTKIATLAFWDAYLKRDAAARAYLESNRLHAFSKGKAELLRK